MRCRYLTQVLDFIEVIKIIILSIVQGITEWLPISSTGHLIIVEDLMPLNLSPEFREIFMVLVQLGSILAVIVLYFNKLNPFAPSKTKTERKNTWVLWFKVAFASIPAGILGLLLNDYMDEYFNTPMVVAIALIVYGFGFIWIENRKPGRHSKKIESLEELRFSDAFKIGLFQALSLIPGTSRSGSTIMGGLLMGTSRHVATEFSFFMGIPVMFGASFWKLVTLGLPTQGAELIYLAIGMIVSFLVSVFAIRFLISYLQRNDFTVFGYYRIVLGAIVILYTLFF